MVFLTIFEHYGATGWDTLDTWHRKKPHLIKLRYELTSKAANNLLAFFETLGCDDTKSFTLECIGHFRIHFLVSNLPWNQLSKTSLSAHPWKILWQPIRLAYEKQKQKQKMNRYLSLVSHNASRVPWEKAAYTNQRNVLVDQRKEEKQKVKKACMLNAHPQRSQGVAPKLNPSTTKSVRRRKGHGTKRRTRSGEKKTTVPLLSAPWSPTGD